MAVQTPGALTALLETGDTPDGQVFADLIDSLRHIGANIPAAEITGLATLIEAAVAARTPGSGDPDLQLTRDGSNIVIRSGTGAPVVLPAASGTQIGGFLPAEKTKLAGIEAGATADQTSAEIITLITSAVGAARLSANALRDLEDVIDARIAVVGGGGPTGSIYTAVTRTVAGSVTYLLPAEHVAKDFVILPTAPGLIKIGTTVGGSELFDYDAPDTANILAETSTFQLAETAIYFTGSFEVRFIIADYA